MLKDHFSSLKKNRTGYQKIGPVIRKRDRLSKNRTGYQKIRLIITENSLFSDIALFDVDIKGPRYNYRILVQLFSVQL